MSISPSVVARVTGVNVEYKNFNPGQAIFLPQRIAVIGQGNTDSIFDIEKKQITTSKEVGETYGYGSPLHLACRQLLPENGNGLKGIPITVYPLEDSDTGVAAAGSIGATGAATASGGGYVYIGGIRSESIVIPDESTNDEALGIIKTAIDAIVNMPIRTGAVADHAVPLTSKWKGESANQITIDISELECEGLVFTTSEMAAGDNNPDVQDALDFFADTWETIVLNCINYDDLITNATYHEAAEARWEQTIKKPFIVATGCVDDFDTRTAITDDDNSKFQRCMFLIQSIASRELPFVIAAQGLVNDIAQKANDKPAHNYIGILQGLQTGGDDEQEDYNTRDAAVKLGASTNTKVGSLAAIADIVSFYHPDGETLPAYRYIVDQIKLFNIIFNLDVIQESLRGRPLLPDGTPTNDPDAVQPKMVLTILSVLADSLASGKSAIISDPNFTKQNMSCSINSENPKRIDTIFPVKLSGNVEVNSTDVYFSFYFGS